ncbi:glutathione S-transferase N-terminal domain-containing protein [Lysobacter sp. A3-1-A15]|uniref:glutathione S-transferase N-terminal domain-containing protein n=1 Tax=Novilysobacter viscosus TaxID=3098602 RepID=UPI002EDA8D77
MIELHYWPTPNGYKIRLLLEEAGLEYRIVPVDIGKGDQFKPDFLEISPNNKMPAIVDHAPGGGGSPLSLFESGAILLYLADKTGRFLPRSMRERHQALQWLFWQVAGLGPMAGQAGHFRVYAPEKVEYGIDRYTREVSRLYGVLDCQLQGRAFVAGDDYSIVDMAIYPWIVPYEAHGQSLAGFPALSRWFETVRARPATARVYEEPSTAYSSKQPLTDEARRILFGQGGPPG